MEIEHWLKVNQTLEFFVEKYPNAFFPRRSAKTKPLRRGIFHNLVKDNREIPQCIIAEVLKRYTAKNRYLKAIIDCSHRIWLDGSEGGKVSEKHKKHAADILAQREQRRLAKEFLQCPESPRPKPLIVVKSRKTISRSARSPSAA